MDIIIKIRKINEKGQKHNINDKEKINTFPKGNEMKKVQAQQKTNCQINNKRKTREHIFVKPKAFNLSSKTLSNYKTNTLLRGLKCT